MLGQRVWVCNYCDAEFDEPAYHREDDSFAWYPPMIPACPYCGTTNITELEDCPACNGFKRPEEKVCTKCQQRLKGELGRFARLWTPIECEVLDDMLDGRFLADFR